MSMTIIMLVCFFILILLSVPIGWALGISSIAALLLSGEPFHIVLLASRLYNSTNSFVLMSLPFFILAGNIMSRGGLSKRLIQLCKTILGPVHGGLGMVGILAAFFFSAISGSNAATTAAVGGMMIPELEKQGYPKDLSTATVAAAGTTGMVIPPSSAMVVFSATASVSLPALFMGGHHPRCSDERVHDAYGLPPFQTPEDPAKPTGKLFRNCPELFERHRCAADARHHPGRYLQRRLYGH